MSYKKQPHFEYFDYSSWDVILFSILPYSYLRHNELLFQSHWREIWQTYEPRFWKGEEKLSNHECGRRFHVSFQSNETHFQILQVLWLWHPSGNKKMQYFQLKEKESWGLFYQKVNKPSLWHYHRMTPYCFCQCWLSRAYTTFSIFVEYV